jgi:predicted negative regulator of RcsB-dependent stress response
VDKLSRKELKTDHFAEEVSGIFDWTSSHKDKVARYGVIAVAVVLVVVAIFGFMRYRAGERQDALAAAMRVDDASVGGENIQGAMHFATQQEKDQAKNKAFGEVASKYPGSDEGSLAQMTLASDAAAKGNIADAEKRYKDVADNGSKAYAGLARLALGQIYAAQGKSAEAQKVLQAAVDNPSETVSKEQATIALARVIATNDPQQALKMLDKLRSDSRRAVSGAATTAYSEVDSATKK